MYLCWGVTKTKTYENEDLRPGLSYYTTKTKTPALSLRYTARDAEGNILVRNWSHMFRWSGKKI